MAEIFVSYRRSDAPETAAALFEQLKAHFGKDQVFRDVDSIGAGEDFEDAIRDAIRAASAVLVIIGPHWLEARDASGTRRLDRDEDYVRREIELALESDTAVIPVLIENAAVPAAQVLPESIASLAKRNAVALSQERWSAGLDGLVRDLEAKGIPALSRAADAERPPFYRVALESITGFVPDLFALLRHPRRFLARATQGRPAELTRAFVFFTLSVSVAVAILLSGYTPADSIFAFGLAVLMSGMLAALVLSVPLWVVWRAVGARRHYVRLLLVLLYQLAIFHLAALVAVWIVLVALDVQSQNIVRDTIRLATQPGTSADAGLRIVGEKLLPFVQAGEMRVALVAAGVLVLCGAAWVLWSWRAYRDAFGLTRMRSTLALAACVAVVWLLVKLAS